MPLIYQKRDRGIGQAQAQTTWATIARHIAIISLVALRKYYDCEYPKGIQISRTRTYTLNA